MLRNIKKVYYIYVYAHACLSFKSLSSVEAVSLGIGKQML